MSDVLIPPWIIPEQESQEWLDEGSAVFRSAFAPGLSQSQSYGGLRLKLSRKHTVRGEEKAQLLSVLKATRGAYNRVRTRVHFALRGSGLGDELITNGTFENGTTGWTSGSAYTLSVQDRLIRCDRNAMTGAAVALSQSSTVAVSQYAPYVQRFFVIGGRGGHTLFTHRAGSTAGGTQYLNDISDIGPGLVQERFTPTSTTAGIGLVDAASTGLVAGDYFCVSMASLVRCMLVDNASNLLVRSDEIDNASWTSVGLGSVTANALMSPDGTTTAETLNQDTSAGGHYRHQSLTVSSSAADYTASCSFHSANRGWAYVLMEEATGGQSAYAFVNLTTGALGTVTSSTNMANARGYVVSQGNGWYELHLVARKTNAATTIQVRLGAATADNTLTYSGSAEAAIYVWRAGAGASSVPFRKARTEGSASTGTSFTSNFLLVKGLPVSSAGLLLPGDWFEINGELKKCTAPLNSDGAGIGYLQFEPSLVRAPSVDDPIITTYPMGKFLISNIKIDNEFGTQARVTYDLEHIYE